MQKITLIKKNDYILMIDEVADDWIEVHENGAHDLGRRIEESLGLSKYSL